MILSLLRDINLRGRFFEESAKLLLRRKNKNNFIFICKNFDDIQELLVKYRLNDSNVKRVVEFVSSDKWRNDLIEFVLNNKEERIIEKINFYEVKSKLGVTKSKYDSCQYNHKFMQKISEFKCVETFLISLVLFENWKFSFNVFSYAEIKLRVYDSVKTHFRSKNKEK